MAGSILELLNKRPLLKMIRGRALFGQAGDYIYSCEVMNSAGSKEVTQADPGTSLTVWTTVVNAGDHPASFRVEVNLYGKTTTYNTSTINEKSSYAVIHPFTMGEEDAVANVRVFEGSALLDEATASCKSTAAARGSTITYFVVSPPSTGEGVDVVVDVQIRNDGLEYDNFTIRVTVYGTPTDYPTGSVAPGSWKEIYHHFSMQPKNAPVKAEVFHDSTLDDSRTATVTYEAPAEEPGEPEEGGAPAPEEERWSPGFLLRRFRRRAAMVGGASQTRAIKLRK